MGTVTDLKVYILKTVLYLRIRNMEVRMKGIIQIVLIISIMVFFGCTSVKISVAPTEKNSGENLSSDTPPKSPIVSASLPKLQVSMTSQGGNREAIPPSCPARALVTQKAKATSQLTDVWCWATSAQMVMNAHGTKVEQCSIVNLLENRVGQLSPSGGPFCCGDNNGIFPGVCHKNGWPHKVFDRYGYDWRYTNGPLSEEDVKGQLCETGPFIYVLLYEGGGGHSIVVKDYKVVDEELFLFVHDHRSIENTNPREPIPIYEIPYEDYAEGIWKEVKHTHSFDYVQIKPR